MHDDFLQVAKGPFLAKGDLPKLLAKTLGEEMAGKLGKEHVEDFAKLFDNNSDNKITFDEYVCGIHGTKWVQVIEADEPHNACANDADSTKRWEDIYTKAAAKDASVGMSKPEFRRIQRLIRARNATSRMPEGSRIVDQEFEAIDKDNDGEISKDEFMRMINKWVAALPTAGGDTIQHAVLVALEKSSGKSDFYIMNSRLGKLTAEEEGLVRYLYKRIDHNNNGSVTFEEFKAFREEFYFTVHADEVVETVFAADKDGDGQLNADEFVDTFRSFKDHLACSNLGGEFFKEHLIDLTTDHWDDANPEAEAPPIISPISTSAVSYGQGSTWHTIGGQSAVAEETNERQEARAEKQAKRDAKKGKVKKRDDFNFGAIFAQKQAELAAARGYV